MCIDDQSRVDLLDEKTRLVNFNNEMQTHIVIMKTYRKK